MQNNKIASLFLLILLFLVAPEAIAQQLTSKITGTITDETNKGFPTVSLRLGAETATMTNHDGHFSLRIPSGTTDSLKISYIGYSTLLIPISKVKEGMLISMKPIINQLNEVRIAAVRADLIVRKAINNIPDNYPQIPFESNGFYREVAKLDSNYLSFAEAGMLVLNQGYGQGKLKDKITVVKERNLKYVGERSVNNPFGSVLKGVPYIVLNNDVVKYPGAIFGKKYLEVYDYKLIGSTMVDDEEAYLISFDQKDGVKAALYQGKMVITKHSFAIVSLDFNLSAKGKPYAVPDIPLLQRPLLSLMGYHFEKKNEQLSLRYYKISEKWYPYFYRISSSHKVRARKQNINGELSITAELFISRINRSPEMNNRRLKEIPDDYSFQQLVNSYNDDYWKAFDDIKPEQSLKALIDQYSRQ